MLLALALALAVQQPQASPQLVDRIAAIVGDKPILLSEVDERIRDARAQGLQIPTDSAQLLELRRTFLQSMIDEELVYQQSRRDTSITVTDQEVQQSVDEQFRNVRGQFRSDAEFTAALQGAGMGSQEEYRRYLSDQARRAAYTRRYVDHQRQEGKLRSGTVSDSAMRAYFDQMKARGQVPRLPASITFKQVVLSPRPSQAAKQRAFQLADSIRVAIEHGADFAAMARQFSMDPTTRANGGDLGWFRRGQMVRQFEEVAFALRPGVPSPVTETEYGFHVIQVDRAQPGQVKARHILIAPAIDSTERAEERERADTVAARLRAGANPDSLAKQYGDSGEVVNVGPADRSQLPAGYAQALATAQAGQVIGPVALNPEQPDRPRLLVAFITSVQPEREATFEDKRDEVRSNMLDQKGLKNLVDDLKRRTYVSVRL